MAWYLQQPGRRGVTIPADVYDKITPVANSITLPMWGRPAHPAQLQWLADNDMTEPSQIHQAYSALPHPNAPSISVGEYPAYTQAMKTFEDHK